MYIIFIKENVPIIEVICRFLKYSMRCIGILFSTLMESYTKIVIQNYQVVLPEVEKTRANLPVHRRDLGHCFWKAKCIRGRTGNAIQPDGRENLRSPEHDGFQRHK